jgi:hypothetical protein
MDHLRRYEPESVSADLLYLADRDADPSRASAGWPGRPEARRVTIGNGWRCETLTLERNGFLALRSPSVVSDFYDENEVRNRFYPELQEFLAKATGASKVTVFAHDVRSSDEARRTGSVREPVLHVHNDYTPKSAPQMVHDVLPGAEAESRLARRFAEINVWRPVRGPVLDHPLAVCDAQSIAPGDLVPISSGLRHEVFMLRFNPAHRWYYFPAIDIDEVILIKGFDSAAGAQARFTAHASFADPSTPPDAPPRESIEARALLFFD